MLVTDYNYHPEIESCEMFSFSGDPIQYEGVTLHKGTFSVIFNNREEMDRFQSWLTSLRGSEFLTPEDTNEVEVDNIVSQHKIEELKKEVEDKNDIIRALSTKIIEMEQEINTDNDINPIGDLEI